MWVQRFEAWSGLDRIVGILQSEVQKEGWAGFWVGLDYPDCLIVEVVRVVRAVAPVGRAPPRPIPIVNAGQMRIVRAAAIVVAALCEMILRPRPAIKTTQCELKR